MAATVLIRRRTDATGATQTDITTGNTVANAQDTHEAVAIGSANPIQVPSSGTNYSFWVTTQLDATVTPSGTINNINWFTDGSNGFGTGVGCIMSESNTYDQATGTVGTTGTELTVANYGNGTTDLEFAPVDAFIRTSGSPEPVSGSISNPTTGLFGDMIIYQITVGQTAGPGPINQETFTWQFDET